MRDEQPAYFDGPTVRERLDYRSCINAVREAMQALSAGETRQLLRGMIDLGPGRIFAQMPGALGEHAMFGAKMVSVFADPASPGQRRHRGLVLLFEPETGAPVALADAEEITHIRTAAASALATDVLARRDAETLLIVGTGAQARAHLHALPLVREFRRVLIWGRSPEKAQALAAEFPALACEAMEDIAAAVQQADVIATVTCASEPVLFGEWVRPGTHVNLVGSSYAGPVEVDSALVMKSRFLVDSRESALAAAAEFLVAREEGWVTDEHIAGEIGEVLLGRVAGRRNAREITIYKSLGHVVQDLAAAAWLYRSARA